MSGPELEARFVGSSPEQIRETEAKLEPYTREADLAPELDGQPSRFRTQTKVWIGLTAACVASWFAAGPVAVTGVVASLIAIPGLLVAGGNDLLQKSARGRRTSKAALQCFLRAIKLGRWREAFAALGAPARSATEQVPVVAALENRGAAVELSSPKGVKRYWGGLVRSTGGMTRFMLGYNIEPLSTKGNVHRYRVTVKIRAYRTLYCLLLLLLGILPGLLIIYAFLTKNFRSSYEVFVYKHKSQWWLLSGKLGLPDRVAKLPPAKVLKK